MNVTVSWTLSGGDRADFYLINITTNASQTLYEGYLNIATGSVKQYELTGFMTGYKYNITVRGVNCGGLVGRESEPLTIGKYETEHCAIGVYSVLLHVLFKTSKVNKTALECLRNNYL